MDFDYEYERYAGDSFLDTFMQNINNTFDVSADEQIKNLKIKQRNLNYETADVIKIFSSDNSDAYYKMLEDSNIDEEIIAIYEMKIIYAYRLFELKSKRLLKAFYPKEVTKGLYKWDVMLSFFKNKGINLKLFKEFENINDLRIVNNNLKHSSEVDNEILAIREFSKIGVYDFEELESFYDRVKDSPIKFLQEIASAISKERYVFDDAKIEAIAHSLAKRMEKKDEELLIKKLSSKY